MSIKINLNNPGMITKGTVLSGTVVCQFQSEENIRGIVCSLRGKEYTRWTQGSGKNSTTYTGKNKFIIQDIILVGHGTISSGVYEYPFTFIFPDSNLPSSYKHLLGSIQYYIKAKVDKPMAFDYTDSLTLHLATPINLNDLMTREQLLDSRYQFEKFPTICCCTSEPVNVDLVLNKRAFIPDEVIEGNLNVENMSNLNVSQIKISVISHIKFTTDKPNYREREEENMIAGRFEEGMVPHSEKSYSFKIRVPQIPLNNFIGCRFITQTWILRVGIIFPSLHRNINCDADIKLGHIPVGAASVTDIPGLEATANFSGENAEPEPEPSAPFLDNTKRPLIDQESPSAPPPTYADASKLF